MVHNFGTVLLCPQNLAVSGANQVLHNIAAGGLYRGNMVLVSPTAGPFAFKFQEVGVAVRIGKVEDVIEQIRDVRFAICNTIMTAHIVKFLQERGVPCSWVLHEWWTKEMIQTELDKRNDKNLTGETVAEALRICAATVSVCQRQNDLYSPAHGEVIYVGTPDVDVRRYPLLKAAVDPMARLPAPKAVADRTITFLCMGIVCPRKNQAFTVKCFKAMAGDRQDVRLIVVGVRRIRDYEIQYVEEVERAIDGDRRIELHDVTHEVDEFYSRADVILLASLNEVTPMVLAEGMARGIPVMTTGIAGVPEMVKDGVEGFICPEEDTPESVQRWADRMTELADSPELRQRMGVAGVSRYMSQFSLEYMVGCYRHVATRLAKPVILVDMDGALVDWDQGFRKAWADRTPIDRQHYEMERCVPSDRYPEAVELFNSEGFFRNLPAMEGGIAALKAMLAKGFEVLICTSPMSSSRYCAQEKWEWVREHLGEEWLRRLMLTMDKTTVRGDVLIDDKPKITGSQVPCWTHVVFDAQYNRDIEMGGRRRLDSWANWLGVLTEELTVVPDEDESRGASGAGDTPPRTPSGTSLSSGSRVGGLKKVSSISAIEVAQLRDFSAELQGTSYLKDYQSWRRGAPKGSKGEYWQAVAEMERLKKQMFLEGDDWSEVHVYRRGYMSWRKGKASGAKGEGVQEPVAAMPFMDTP